MAPPSLLKKYGLVRNPFTDRTAENTDMNAMSLYESSDLQHFKPTNETYIFFGKRGSGKTTVRMRMQQEYERANEELRVAGSPEHFIVDLCRPGHMTACLKDFQENIHSSEENWDAAFKKSWTISDLVDCIYSYAMGRIVSMLTTEDEEGKKHAAEYAARLRSNSRIARQVILLTALYARSDQETLRRVRKALLPWTWLADANPVPLKGPHALFAVASLAGIAVVGTSTLNMISSAHASSSGRGSSRLGETFGEWMRDAFTKYSWQVPVGAAAAGAAGTGVVWSRRHAHSIARARQLQSHVRVVKRRPVEDVASILDLCIKGNDQADTIRAMQIGISAHQKLEKLLAIVQLLGFQSLPVFGDCFDEVTFLDPVVYPEAMKQFAASVCRNDLLNFGRMHFFLPGDRMSLDLTTDTVVKEARFDRHFVRDMTWSRHQLTELAERRFEAAQEKPGASGRGSDNGSSEKDPKELTAFSELFKEVSGEDFAGVVGKLSTPRELLIMMTVMFSRIERNPNGKLTAKDMEAAVEEAQNQSV